MRRKWRMSNWTLPQMNRRDFDDQMRAVKAVTGATGKEFDMLTEKAKLLGRTTSFTTSQVASAMIELGRAGFAPKEIDEAIPSVLNLTLNQAKP